MDTVAGGIDSRYLMAAQEAVAGLALDLLFVEDLEDLSDQLQVRAGVVCMSELAKKLAALVRRTIVDVVNELDIEDLVDEGTVVGGFYRACTRDEVDLWGVGAAMKIHEDLGGTLACTDDGDSARIGKSRNVAQIAAGVEDPWVVLE